MGSLAGAQAAPTRSAIQPGTGHDVMSFKAQASWEAVLPTTLTSKAKPRTVSGRDDALLGYFEAAWCSCALNGNGSEWLSVRLSLVVSIRDAMLGYFRGCMGQPRSQW